MNRRAQLRARRALAVGVAGLALVLVAFVFDASPLFVPGIALVAIAVIAPLWVLWSVRGARIRRRLDAERVLEGAELWTTLELRRPLSPDGWGRLEVSDPISHTTVGLGGPGSPLRRSRVGHLRVVVRLTARGEHRLAPPTLVARDPLELARAQRVGDGPSQTVLVLPRPQTVRWLGAGDGARVSRGTGDGHSEALAATDLEGLRPYRPGTPASRIHWPALAAGRGLIERRLQADADHRPLLVLDARARPGDPAPLDAVVRAVASIALELARHGGCGLLLPGQTRATVIDAELSAWPAAHARLAVVGTSADPQPARPPGTASAAGRSGPLIYAAAASHARLTAALLASGSHGGVVLVVPEAEIVDGRPRGVSCRATPVLSVSGCRGFALGATRVGARPRAGAQAGAR